MFVLEVHIFLHAEIKDVAGPRACQGLLRHWCCCLKSYWYLGWQLVSLEMVSTSSLSEDIDFDDASVLHLGCRLRFHGQLGCREHEHEHQRADCPARNGHFSPGEQARRRPPPPAARLGAALSNRKFVRLMTSTNQQDAADVQSRCKREKWLVLLMGQRVIKEVIR